MWLRPSRPLHASMLVFQILHFLCCFSNLTHSKSQYFVQITFYFTLYTVLHFGLECSVIAATLRTEGTTFVSLFTVPEGICGCGLVTTRESNKRRTCSMWPNDCNCIFGFYASLPPIQVRTKALEWGCNVKQVLLSTSSHAWVKVTPACADLVYTECAWTRFYGIWKMCDHAFSHGVDRSFQRECLAQTLKVS